jgi:putative membrane protein
MIWACVGLVAQYLAYQITHRLLIRDWAAHVENENVAAGIFAAAISLAIGLLNAASMTY